MCCLQTADFGPRTALKIVDSIRNKVKAGKIEKGDQIRSALKASITELLQKRGGNPDLRLGQVSPAVVLVVGVNGGGKTTSIGKLAHKFTSEGASVRWMELGVRAAVHISSVEAPSWGGSCQLWHQQAAALFRAGCHLHSHAAELSVQQVAPQGRLVAWSLGAASLGKALGM